MKYITVLCCLDPSINTNMITEYTFLSLLSPVALICNVKLISNDGQVKAFIQLPSQNVAQKLIDITDQKTTSCGRLRLYLSHKKFVGYPKRIKEIMREKKGVEACFVDDEQGCLATVSGKDTKSTSIENTISNLKIPKNGQNAEAPGRHVNAPIHHQVQQEPSPAVTSLIVRGTSPLVSAEDICRMAAQTCVPRSIFEYVCFSDMKVRFLIEFTSTEECAAVFQAMNKRIVHGKKLCLDLAKEQKGNWVF